MKTYEEWLRGRGATESTIHARTKFHQSRLREWTTMHVDDLTIAAYLDNYTGWSRLTYHHHLDSIYAWMIATAQIPSSPMRDIKKPPVPRPRPSALNEAELLDAMGAADTRTAAFLTLGYYAGLRAFEIAKIHGSHVTVESLYVAGKGGRVDLVPTHARIWQLAQQLPRDNYWFPSPVFPGQPIASGVVTRSVGGLFRSLGLRGATHRTRHSMATHMVRHGVRLEVVQDLMRHSSLNTTRVYLRVDEDDRIEALRTLAA